MLVLPRSSRANAKSPRKEQSKLYGVVPVLEANSGRVQAIIARVKKVAGVLWKLSGKQPQNQ